MAWIRGLLALAFASALLLASDWWLKRGAEEGPGKKRRLAFIQYIQSPEVDEAEAGVRAGLKESGLVEGEDYEITVRNASGDMPTMLGLIDAALQDGADMLVTFSTPTLQAAMNKTNRVPVVFTFVMDPVAAGAGRSYVDHRANITGVYTHAPCDAILDCVREFIPGVRRIGTLTVPAEVNSVYARDLLVAAAKKRNIEVVDLPLAAASDVPDAAAALCTRRIDAVVIVASNLTMTTFPTIASAARRARLPVFGSTSSEFENGAVAAVANDFFDAGHGSGKLAARVMRGEKPGAIPFQPTGGTQLLLNARAAEHCGLKLPAALRARADKVKE
jgi:ABC-type uncharacterized transport system substrate-binding protein